MEYITLYLHTDDECAGIQDDDNHCQTIRKDINAGNSFVWKRADLGSCEDATYFQSSAQKITFKIKAYTRGFDNPFCPSKIEIRVGDALFVSVIEKKLIHDGYRSDAYTTGKSTIQYLHTNSDCNLYNNGLICLSICLEYF